MWLQLAVNGVTSGVGLAVVALGFAMVLQWRGVPNFAHGAAVAIGGYVSYVVADAGLGYLPGLPAAALAGMLVGLVVELRHPHRRVDGAWRAGGDPRDRGGGAARRWRRSSGERHDVSPRAVPSGHVDLLGAVLPRVQANAFLLDLALLALAWIGSPRRRAGGATR